MLSHGGAAPDFFWPGDSQAMASPWLSHGLTMAKPQPDHGQTTGLAPGRGRGKGHSWLRPNPHQEPPLKKMTK
jgi:hypothetical protein